MVEFINDESQKRIIAERILYKLSDWFGVPKYTNEYIEKSAKMPFWAYEKDGEYIGFISLKSTSEYTAEIYVMGVLPQYHREGVGRKLFNAFASFAKEHGYEFLQVKTVEKGHYQEYDRTVAFYESIGFRMLEVFPTLWDEHNPCMVMVKRI